MTPIDDNELILYHYRDGLDAARTAQIEAALRESSALSARYFTLCSTLQLAGADTIAEPDTGYESRLWRGVEARIAASPTPAHRAWGARLTEWIRDWAPPKFALASALGLVLALGIAYDAGRRSAPEPDAVAQERANAMATRVLDAYVAAHLRTTEGVLLTAANSDSAPLQAGNRDIAVNLLASNRLYANAAQRNGDTRLADFLRQLEPILIELANRGGNGDIQSSDGLRNYLKQTDLLFQVRATQARIDASRRPKTI